MKTETSAPQSPLDLIAQEPTPTDNVCVNAIGHLSFLMSAIRCGGGDQLSPDEEAVIMRMVHRLQAHASTHEQIVEALKDLVAETERCDRPGLYGVASDDDVMTKARAALDLVAPQGIGEKEKRASE